MWRWWRNIQFLECRILLSRIHSLTKKLFRVASWYNAVLQPRLCVREAFYSEIILGTKYSVSSVFLDLHMVQGHGLSTKYIICSEKILGTKYSLPGMFSFLWEAFDPGLKEKSAKCYSVPRTHSVCLKKKMLFREHSQNSTEVVRKTKVVIFLFPRTFSVLHKSCSVCVLGIVWSVSSIFL